MMMTQSIPTQASLNLLGVAGSANASKRSREYNFELLLAGNINRDNKIEVKAKEINGSTQNIDGQRLNQSADSKEKVTDNIPQDKQDMKPIETDNSSLDKQAVDNVAKQKQGDEDIIDMDILGQLMTMLDQIKNVIMKELDITPEELDSLMKELGIEPSDLTEPQTIITLVMAVNKSTEPLAMLLDEQLGNKIQDLLAKVEDIKSEANLKLTDEEIKLILERSVTVEQGEAVVDKDEVIDIRPQHISEEPKDETDKPEMKVDKPDREADKHQAVAEDKEAENQQKILAPDKEAESKNTNDRKAKADKADGFELFLDKLSANYDKPIEDFSDSAVVRLMEIREIAQQIIDEIRVVVNPEKTSMELQLSPEHLGKVNLTISSKEGVMTAHFTVQNDLAKEAIEGQLIVLKDTLAQQGIKVDTIDVTVAGYTFDQQSPSDSTKQEMHKKQKSGHKITFEEAIAMSEEPIEVNESVNLTDSMGYNIDYTA